MYIVCKLWNEYGCKYGILLGLLTGSVYKDYALLKNGFPAESVVNSSVSVVKTHEFGEGTIKSFNKVILLIRNPYEALQAEFNRRSGGHVGHAPAEKYSKEQWQILENFCEHEIEILGRHELGLVHCIPAKRQIGGALQ